MIEEQLFLTQTVNWTKVLGITLPPRTAHSPWTNGKVETQNRHIARFWEAFWIMLALTGLPSHQRLPSRTVLVLITLLEKLFTKSYLAPNHRFLCLSNWDSIVINITQVSLNSVPTCLLILTMKTLRRTNSERNYFDHSFLSLCWTEKEISNEFTLPLLNGVENKKTVPTHTETDLNWDTI